MNISQNLMELLKKKVTELASTDVGKTRLDLINRENQE